jgi:lipopolysaccharide transport system permease protein
VSFLNPVAHWRAGRELTDVLASHRHLTWEMTRRELSERYAGQVLGAFWAIGHPILMMVVYVFLFAVVFGQKLDLTALKLPANFDFTVYILAGIAPWLVFAEAMAKGTSAVVGNSSLVKQIVFPIEILPMKIVLASAFTHVIFTLILLGYIILRLGLGYVTWMMALIPVLMVIQVIAMAGICYAFAAIGCYLRDLKEFVTVFLLINLYLMPVVYLPDWVPGSLRPILYVNPFSYMTWCYQDAFVFGRFEHPIAWVVFPLLSIGCFTFGYRTFRKLKPQFGNVL